MKRINFARLAALAPLAVLAPKVVARGEVLESGGPEMIDEKLEELLVSGQTLIHEVPDWGGDITAHWYRIPPETYRRMADGLTQSFTRVYRFADAPLTRWTEYTKIAK